MKWRRWIVGVAVTAGLVLGVWWLSSVIWARSWEAKWRDFQAEWEAKGEDFGMEAHLAPEVPEEENFARHPWIVKIVAGDPQVLERIEAMQAPDDPKVEDLLTSFGGLDEFVIRVESDPELTVRLRNHFTEFEVEMEAFSEAVARPEMRLDVDLNGGLADLRSPWARCSEVGELIKARARLSLAAGDGASAVPDVESLIHFGNHLRHERFLMGLVFGKGADAVADKLINDALDRDALARDERERLARALEVERPSVEEALTAMLRLERGVWLREVDRMQAEVGGALQMPSRKVSSGLAPKVVWIRAFFARNRLALCEDLQLHLLAEGDGVRKVIRVEDMPAYVAALEARFAEDNPQEVIAAIAGLDIRSILRHMQRVEEMRRTTLERLRGGQ